LNGVDEANQHGMVVMWPYQLKPHRAKADQIRLRLYKDLILRNWYVLLSELPMDTSSSCYLLKQLSHRPSFWTSRISGLRFLHKL